MKMRTTLCLRACALAAILSLPNILQAIDLPAVSSGTLQLWLKADAGVTADAGGLVSQWNDQSPNANHATQPDSVKQPTLVTGAVPVSGKPVLRFDGVQSFAEGDYLQGTEQLDIAAGFTGFLFYLRANPAPVREQVPVGLGVPGQQHANRLFYIRSNFGGGDDEFSFSGWANDYGTRFIIPVNAYRIWTLRLSEDMTQVDLIDNDGTTRSPFTFTRSGLQPPQAGYFVGGLGTQVRNLQGDIAEVIVYKGALSDADLAAVENYLVIKYYQPSTAPYVASTAPAGKTVAATESISIQVKDNVNQLAPASVQLLVNAQAVTPVISKVADVSTIAYTPPAPWRPATYNVRLIFADNATPPLVQTNDFSFTVPGPSVTSRAPLGEGISANATIKVELTDVNTQVDQNSIQLFLNGQSVSPVISKPAGSAVTTVTYAPAGGFVPASANVVRIIFGDTSTPPILATNEFSFSIIDPVLAATVINIDFNGVRNVPGPDVPGPTYDGVSAAGGARLWNGILADSRIPGSTTDDDDNLTVTGTDLKNSLGDATTVSFTVSPMGGDVGGAPTTDPTSAAALLSDYVFNLSAGNTTAESPFQISGLGDTPFVDLYFYRGSGGVSVAGATRAPFTARGIFTTANTYYYSHVMVTNGVVDGLFGPGTAVVYGMSIVKPLPRPYLTSASPVGGGIRANVPIDIQLQDYVTQVVPGSVQLLVNGQAVTATVSKPAGSAVTTITYSPAGGWVQGSTNTYTIVFGDSASPAIVQSNSFTFAVLDEAVAAVTINIDFNGLRNIPGNDPIGPTFVGAGAAGGGTTWNGVLVLSKLEDGTDEDNLTITANNLVNSLGGATTVGFTVAPVAGDNAGAGDDPTAGAALLGDYLFVASAGQVTGLADYTISGLGSVPFVDLYFYFGANGNFGVPGSTPAPFVGGGLFSAANTRFFSKVGVTNGTITGTVGIPPGGRDVTVVLYGITIQKPLPRPYVKSSGPTGRGVKANAAISIELQDYVTQVVTNTIQLLVNDQAVSPAIAKAAGVTTVSYSPAGGFASESTNTVKLVFSDNASPPNVQTVQYSFVIETFVAPRAQDPGADGLLVLEAEHSDDNITAGGNTWTLVTAPAGFSGDGAMQALPDSARNVNIDISASPRLDYKVKFVKTGTHYVWVRGLGDSTPGASASDSVNVGLDGVLPTTSSRISGFPDGSGYVWSSGRVDPTVDIGPARLDVTALGEHQINVWMREDGFIIDKLLLTSSSSYRPTGTGPAESSRGEQPRLNIALQGNNIALSWTGAATLQAAEKVTGPYTDMAGASPVTITPSETSRFYRLRQ